MTATPKKTEQPPAPGADIPRPRLFALLDDAVQSPLAVVHAGAGFGKTQAVAGYLRQAGHRAVWHPLSPLDNIPSRFWENLTATFARHRPALGEIMRRLGFPESLLAFDTFLGELTRELYRDRLFVVFVFDDLHLITEPAVKSFLSNLIAARMENNCILLISRQWPVFEGLSPAPAKLIGTGELRFTDGEATELFEAAGLQLADDEAAEFNRYVAGWPIALSLVALSLRRDAAAGGAEALPGAKPALFSLFEREIFSQYTPPEQSLLIKLSALDSFPRGLVHTVTGEKGRDLAQLMDTNPFIQYNAGARRFYFHPLYHEFLQEKLLSIKPAERADAYRQAAAWCRENGHYFDAVNYYRQYGDFEGVWSVLLRFDANRHTRTEAEFFIEQIGAMPEDFRQSHPMTGIVLAVMLVNNLRFDEAREVLDAVERRLEAEPDGPDATALLGEYNIARGLLLLGMEQNGFEVFFTRAAKLLPKGSRRWGRSLRLVDLGPALNLQSAKAGELKKSLACFIEGVPHMVRVLHGAGQGMDKLCDCEAKFLTGDYKGAAEAGYQALYAAQSAAQHDIVGNALFMLMRIFTLTGEYQNLTDTLAQIEHYAAEDGADALGIWDIAKGWFYAELGEAGRVAGWVRNASRGGPPPISMDRALLVQARCLIATGQHTEALALLAPFGAAAEAKGAVITRLYIELCRAVAHSHLGNHGPAIGALKAAYVLAKGNKLFTPFIEYGNRTRTLLERAAETPGHGIPADWLEQTHARAATFAKRHAYLAGRYRQEHRGASPDFGLSRREAELLSNLSQGLTREEISGSMDLSLNTVKSMLKQVFAKLGAVNSADAIRIAVVNKLI